MKITIGKDTIELTPQEIAFGMAPEEREEMRKLLRDPNPGVPPPPDVRHGLVSIGNEVRCLCNYRPALGTVDQGADVAAHVAGESDLTVG